MHDPNGRGTLPIAGTLTYTTKRARLLADYWLEVQQPNV